LSAADDELAVRNVIARLAQYADGPDVDAYVDLFAPDALWEMPGAPTKRGQAEIRAGSAERRATGGQGPGSNTRHAVSTIAVTVDGDSAVADSYWQFWADTSTAPRVALMGVYRDEFVRTDTGWKLYRRQITFG